MTDITTRLLSMSEAMYMDRDHDELDALLLEAKGEIERLRAALRAAKTRMRNCRGAIESDQVIDKDVHGSLARGISDIDAALAPQEPAPESKPFVFADPARQAEWERQRKERGVE